jgi:hypothetical protein
MERMADVNKLKESIVKAEEKVAKCKGTIVRHEKALEKKLTKVAKHGVTLENLAEKRDEFRGTEINWELYEVESKLSDIKGATKKLKEAEEVLSNWKAKLDKEESKDAFVKNNAPKAIVEFLEKWKEMAYDWHVKRCEESIEYKKEVNGLVAERKAELEAEGIYWRDAEKVLKEEKLDWKSVEKAITRNAGSTLVLNMMAIRDEAERLAWLNEILEADKRAKLIDLIYRVNEVVGEITDASYLEVNEKGNLDGYIVGKEGKANVETIGAGGYNIVCFHYRTLVKPIK